jgi:hypothetical protein
MDNSYRDNLFLTSSFRLKEQMKAIALGPMGSGFFIL